MMLFHMLLLFFPKTLLLHDHWSAHCGSNMQSFNQCLDFASGQDVLTEVFNAAMRDMRDL